MLAFAALLKSVDAVLVEGSQQYLGISKELIFDVYPLVSQILQLEQSLESASVLAQLRIA